MATDIEKKIYDPKRGVSVRAQNMEALKKTGKAVSGVAKKKSSSLLRGAARFAAPAAVGYGAAERIAEDPTDPENVLTSGIRSAADIIDAPISATSQYFGGPKIRPVGTAIDVLGATGEAIGSGLSDIQYQRDPEEIDSNFARNFQTSLRQRQGELYAEPTAIAEEGVAGAEAQPDITGLGTPIPYTAGTTVREGQTDEGYTRRVEGPGGSFGEITTEAERTGETPEQVQEALAGVEARSDVRVQNILAQQEQARQERGPTTASQIQELEEQLATPGRGLRQSFGELMTEQQGRRSASARLKELYAQQKEGQQQAGQSQRAALVSQDKARDRSLRYQELVGKRGDTATRERTALRKEAQSTYEEQAKARFDDPKDQAFFVAQNLETHLPGSSFDTPHGRIVRRDAMEDLVQTASKERGLFDWIATKLPGKASEDLTYDDFAKIDFGDWNIDKGEIVLPESITSNDAFRTKEGNYAYFDNMSPRTVWFIKQMIMDSKRNKTQTVRKGQ